MGWKVRITGLAPGQRARIPQIAQILAKLPGVTAEQALRGLQHPPFDLPSVKTDEDARKLSSALTRLGLTNQIFLERTSELPAEELSSATKPADPDITPIRNPVEIQTGSAPQRPTDIRPLPLSSEKRQKKRAPVGALILSALVLGAGILFWNRKVYIRPTETPIITEIETTSTTSSRKTHPRSDSARAAERKMHEEARRLYQYSEYLLKQAEQTADIRKSAAILENALQYNPYNSGAWLLLIEKYRRIGNHQARLRAEQGLERSEKVRRVLESLANQFGVESRVNIRTDRVHFHALQAVSDRKVFYHSGEKLYDTIRADHPEKAFLLEQGSQTRWRIEVNPGEDYPDYQNWSNAETSENGINPEKSGK